MAMSRQGAASLMMPNGTGIFLWYPLPPPCFPPPFFLRPGVGLSASGENRKACGGANGIYYGPKSCCNPEDVCVLQNFYFSQVRRRDLVLQACSCY